jgi:hypothetical protein
MGAAGELFGGPDGAGVADLDVAARGLVIRAFYVAPAGVP